MDLYDDSVLTQFWLRALNASYSAISDQFLTTEKLEKVKLHNLEFHLVSFWFFLVHKLFITSVIQKKMGLPCELLVNIWY